MYRLEDTICAICTPRGVGALAAIRVSGSHGWSIVDKIFRSSRHSALGTKHFSHMHAEYGFILDEGKKIDEVVILPYKAPKSFTGDDVVEIFCHGGVKVPSLVLDLCIRHGARRAAPGEFSFRAFINGRIDLTKAEAINEMVNACTGQGVENAANMISGSLKDKVMTFKEKLFSLITILEGQIEFPLDVDSVSKESIKKELEKIKNEMNSLIISSNDGRLLRDGIMISIVGLPNVGKSSLLNKLLENERAIVTKEPGTTRDTIEEKVILDGFPVVLVDTAGIREHKLTSDAEKGGIERTKLALNQSDIVLFVEDITEESPADSLRNDELLKNKPMIIVGNKVDLAGANGKSDNNKFDIKISAKYGTNIDELKRLVVEKIKGSFAENMISDHIVFVNERQKELLMAAYSNINGASEMLLNCSGEDLISDELKKAVSKLDEVSGLNVSEEVIRNIFAKFCIGK